MRKMGDLEDIRNLIFEKGPYSREENLKIYQYYFSRKAALDKYVLNLFRKYNMDKIKVLDIGCQYGHFLIHLSRQSWGVDINEHAINFAKAIGLNVEKYNIEKGLPFEDESFDGVFCSHVLEHVSSPHNLLVEIHRVLKREGVSILIVPRYTKFYKGYANPDHIYAFTLETFSFLVERTGFNIKEKKGYISSIPSKFNDVFAPFLKKVSTQIILVAKKKVKEDEDEDCIHS